MKANNNNMDALIGKDVTDELTPEERIVLEDWLEQAEENRIRYRHLKTIFHAGAQLRTHQVFDTDAAWMKFRDNIKARSNKGRTIQFFIRIAASVVLVITAGIFLYQKFLIPQDVMVLSSAHQPSENVLPDGSGVFLNKNSSVAYAYDPVKRIRKTTLSGEAYFKIAENNKDEFLLEAEGLWIKDIGTSFNVKAYPGADTVEVFVEEGEVVFYTPFNAMNIQAGETGYFSRQQNTFSKSLNRNQNVLAYKTQILVFENAQLSEVFETINEVYDIKLKLGQKGQERCRITVTFKHETIDIIAEVIAETLSLTLEKNNHEITFKGNGCGR